MTQPFTHRRRVAFAETDMAGIVHFSQFFRYMEDAEHALFRSLGLSVVTTHEGRDYGWPRVSATCDYQAPLKFEDEFDVRLDGVQVRSKAIEWHWAFVSCDDKHRELARGRITTVCVTKTDDGRMKSTDIPQEIASRVRAAAAPAEARGQEGAAGA